MSARVYTELSNRLGPSIFSAAHRGKELKVSFTRALRATVLGAGQSLNGGRRQGGDTWRCVPTLGTMQRDVCGLTRRSSARSNAKTKEAKWFAPSALG